ncbi:MAG TPA: DUF3105 domain-containing protein [Solirubrobacterales bacterium]|nr:DUF3105 domain-containing protein [Solirubrobacterales bacterium]
MSEEPRDRDELRQQREQAEAADSSRRTRLMVAYGAAAVAVVAIVVVVVVLVSGGSDSSTAKGDAHINLDEAIGSTNGIVPDERLGTKPPPLKVANLATAAKQAGCELKLHLRDEGHQHIPPGSPTPDYKTNPPTSGPHVEPPFQQADGAYSEMPAEIDIVHSLEHGRLEIQYSPDLSEADQLELKGLYDTMYGATLLFPNENMPYEVAATTWTNMLACPTYKGAITLDAIRDFGKATWGKYGGEPVYAFTFTGPTPREPQE